MSIVSEIERIKTNIANAYTACEGKGATLPSILNSANLADCIASITGGGLSPQLEVTIPWGKGVPVTVTNGVTTYHEVYGTEPLIFNLDTFGEWTITAEGFHTLIETIEITEIKMYEITLNANDEVYGAQWDGTASPLWSRTDDAKDFAEPIAYTNGSVTYGSPFDNIEPWAGIKKVTDSVAGELVSIPKYWYKWTRTDNSMKLQISPREIKGYLISPAHADRGDGKGERDVVYVGRYKCSSENYSSTTGKIPKVSITRAVARTNIHDLGEGIWQMDYSMFWTIAMLYLVEYATWDTQSVIGRGCTATTGKNTSVFATGNTDSMPYHTGTVSNSISNYGSTQYRWIEDLWGNCFDWVDGIYFSVGNVYCINNPINFSDASNGTLTGTRAQTAQGIINAWNNPTVSGFEYALYPSVHNASAGTYITDECLYSVNGTVLAVGGNFSVQTTNVGLFFFFGYGDASYTANNIGCRLQKLV